MIDEVSKRDANHHQQRSRSFFAENTNALLCLLGVSTRIKIHAIILRLSYQPLKHRFHNSSPSILM